MVGAKLLQSLPFLGLHLLRAAGGVIIPDIKTNYRSQNHILVTFTSHLQVQPSPQSAVTLSAWKALHHGTNTVLLYITSSPNSKPLSESMTLITMVSPELWKPRSNVSSHFCKQSPMRHKVATCRALRGRENGLCSGFFFSSEKLLLYRATLSRSVSGLAN